MISTGDLFTTTNYPVIDLAAGGTINGIIDGLNQIIDLIIPVYGQEGGTLVIPGHGRLCDLGDVINYREMATIVRDRVQDMVNKGMTLEQVKAARPTRDYDPLYGSTTGFWTTDLFVEAVYKTLSRRSSTMALGRSDAFVRTFRGRAQLIVGALALVRPPASWPSAGRRRRTEIPEGSGAVDLTGYWVSIVSEDWRFRMVTAPKGDYPNVPLNAEGKKVADAWDPAKDEASGDRCKAYGAPNIMRRARPLPHHLGRRCDAEDRDRRRDADASAPRSTPPAAPAPQAAAPGLLDRRVGRSRRR